MVVAGALAAFSQGAFRGATRGAGTLVVMKTTAKEQPMTLHTAIVLNAVLDLGIVLAVAAVMYLPFTFDSRKDEAAVYAFAAPLPEDLAA